MRRLSSRFAGLVVLAVWVAALAGEAAGECGAGAKECPVEGPVIAYWAFDEEFGDRCGDSGPDQCDASPEGGKDATFERIQGVFGNAVRFAGRHRLRSPGKPVFGRLAEISFSAWTMPTGFETYNEIFRKEDGDNRVLFAFQEHGRFLSLGLNVNGYVECDAKISPEQVLDGQWHHCAATFDGKRMRVYLDGKEIGSRERPGVVVTGGNAPGCIGSAHGVECFQGAIDELRIYGKALTGEQIVRLHQDGREAVAAMAQVVAADEPSVKATLLAHWTFNERGSAAVIHDATGTGELIARTKMHPRRRGVHGNALTLRGPHRVKVNIGPKVENIARITFFAWTKPTDLKGNREIFRQECPERLLFSFQENGGILSFGVNVDGYRECDARIDVGRVLDGRWHHCAATFDGKAMRVYLDAQEVGSLERLGALTTAPAAPAFIGSSAGGGEHFQGAIDDLRIYSDALSAEQIGFLYKSGLAAVARCTKEQEEALRAFYVPAESFAETLANARKNLMQKKVRLTKDLAEIAVIKLSAQFPEEYQKFATWTKTSPIDYLVSTESALDEKLVGPLVDLMLEYKPLTEHQQRMQTPEQRGKWQEAEAIQQKFEEMKGLGEAGRFSPEWIRIALDAGCRIQFRPVVREPVAPYMTPSTPETRNLTAEEARTALERDWLHQANNKPTPKHIRNEIRWRGKNGGHTFGGG